MDVDGEVKIIVISQEGSLTVDGVDVKQMVRDLNTTQAELNATMAILNATLTKYETLRSQVESVEAFMGDVVNGTFAVTFPTVDTGQGANELYAMDQDVLSTSDVMFDNLVVATIDSGQGATEVYRMDQDVRSTDAVSFASVAVGGAVTASTLDTGQGANELYAMDQDVRTSDSVVFSAMTVTGDVAVGGTVDGVDLSVSALDWESRITALETAVLALTPIDWNAWLGDFSGFDLSQFVSALSSEYGSEWGSADVPSIVEYNHGLATNPVNGAYMGGVYSPTQNRIYFVPYLQADEVGKNWHYLDCDSGLIVEYNHGLATNPVDAAYIGGVYSPTQNRIYFVPYLQADEVGKNWHYLDCASGLIVEYNHGLATNPVNSAYRGGVYSPTQNRIYFVPHLQADEVGKNWHYVDCASGLIVEYNHGFATNPVNGAYIGGVYSPTQNRIYFVPLVQADEVGKNWHYVDCASGLIVEYNHGLATNPVDGAYYGGVYSPTQNRIYFVPYLQADEVGKNWHYLDCDSGLIVEYNHGLATNPVNGAYAGGVYSPTQNRIYFVPFNQADEVGKNWHYLDCDSGLIVEYNHGLATNPVNGAYTGGVYSPTQNRIYFVPFNQADEVGKNWHYIDTDTGHSVDPQLMANSLFNKF